MKIFLAHPTAIDYATQIYTPLRASALGKRHEFFLPHEHEIEEITKETVRGCDAFVIDISAASTGGGIELGWADAFNVPTIAMHSVGTRLPNSVRNIVGTSFEYESADDMLTKLDQVLETIHNASR